MKNIKVQIKKIKEVVLEAVADHQVAAVPLEAVVEEVAAEVDAEVVKVKTMNNIFFTQP
jgi:hypothetical protein